MARPLLVLIMDEEKFVISDDKAAEWALKKIKAATAERDRLMALINEERRELDEKEADVIKTFDNDTSYLKHLLCEYMRGVECKSTKTQDTYSLLSGKLVRKHESKKLKCNDDALKTWLENAGYREYLNVTVKPKWAEVKKLCVLDDESGIVTFNGGEIIDGVEVVTEDESFEVKF